MKLAVPEAVLLHALGIEPSATGVPLPADAAGWPEAIEDADPGAKAVLAVGPGLVSADALRPALDALLDGPRALVLDADGLNALAASGRRGAGTASARVLTPHPGEFRRLAAAVGLDADPVDPDRRRDAAQGLARIHGCVVVLKGHRTVIADPHRATLNATGNPALATAGSGDVLTGLLASLLAQGMDAFDAARLATHAHGRAADAWAARHGPAGLLARELADGLPAALRARG